MELFTERDLSQSSRLSGNTAAMLTALADIGCNKHVIAALLDPFKLKPDHQRFLTGPVIQHRSQWADTTPPWLYQAITGDRLRIILDEHARGVTGWHVGPAEITAVMYPATMDAPMQMEWADIYLWASAQASARHYRKTVDEIWSGIGGAPVPDSAVAKPGGRYYQDYRHLCSDIRRRVIKAATPTDSKSPAARKDAVSVEQFSLF